MPTRVTAADGDSLCSIAVAHGLPNCTPLRAEGANSGLLNRALRRGDRVTVPDQVVRRADGSVERRHRFRRPGVPLPSLRLLHGSPDQPPANDPTLTHLNVSNYRTNRAGRPAVAGQPAFPRANTSAFNANAHLDVDAFKVEVHDPHRAQPNYSIEIRAVQPVYDARGRITGHQDFAGTDRADRALTVTCRPSRSDPTRYRSCYCRLVTDAVDKRARRNETLLVTDMADGVGGANDRVEILDQRVVGELPLTVCAAPGGQYRCRARLDVQVGDNARRRFRVQVHVLRTAPGAATLVGGLSLNDVRRHMNKWLRRTYAQANMSLRFLTPDVDAIDPAENLVSIFNPGRRVSAGHGRIRVRVNSTPATVITYSPTAGQTPLQIATQIATRINAVANFNAQAFGNAVAFNNGQSADIVITRSDGNRVVIDRENSTDPRSRVGIGRVRVNSSPMPAANYWTVGARPHRTLMRNHALTNNLTANPNHHANALHVYVIRRFSTGDLGAAYTPEMIQAARYRTVAPVAGCCFVISRSVAANDRFVHTTDHELGHILGDMEHFSGRSFELMTDVGEGARNRVGSSKRLTDADLRYAHSTYLPGHAPRRRRVHPVNDTRNLTMGRFIEAWPR